MTSQPDPSTPRLADRLSALVGQATARQEDTVTSERFLTAIVERLGEISEEVSAKTAAIDSGLRSHVDEVGGALVLRLDEVASSLNKQVTEVELGLRDSLATTLRPQADEPDLRGELAKITEELQEVRSELAAGQAATASLSAELGAVAGDLSALQAGVEGMSSQLSLVEESLGRRVDEAALALAETLVALLNPGDAPVLNPASPSVAEPIEALAAPVLPLAAEDEARADEEAIQAVGVDDGSALTVETELAAEGAQPQGAPAEAASTFTDTKKRGLFRR